MNKIYKISLILLSLISFSSCSRYRVSSEGVSQNQNESNNENKIDENKNDSQDKVNIIEGEYDDLIKDGIGDLYPCQFVNAYIESSVDYVSYSSGSSLSSLIIQSGGVNVLDSLFNVDINNVTSSLLKNLDVSIMIKIVNKNILGDSISSLNNAKNIKNSILNRENWNNLNFIKTQNVLLMSEELLDSSKGRLYFKLIAASFMYPALFKNLDIEKANNDLLENKGIYYFY